jgi:Raf kinase inhibitor-like YbhB/YbcL family protein
MVAALTAAFLFWSPAFPHNQPIPRRFTCDGANVSPPLRWQAPPRGTKAFALEVIDLDSPGGTFTHWTLWNLPASAHGIPAHVKWHLQGRNTFGRIGYGGPCPPAGRTHHYVFELYALRGKLSLSPGAAPQQFVLALHGRVIANRPLVGTYRR